MILLGYLATGLLYGVCFMFSYQLWKDRHELLKTDWRDNVISREESDQLELEREVEMFCNKWRERYEQDYKHII